jgi:hypothetical protein
MRHMAWRVVAILVLGGVLAMPANAQEPAITFDGDGPLTVAPGAKASLLLLNNTVDNLSVTFQVIDETGANSTALTLDPAQAPLRAGGVVLVTATAGDPAPIKGFVIASATPRGAARATPRVARRAFSVQAHAPTLEPLVSKWNTTSYRGAVVVAGLRNEIIPLKGATSCPADPKPVEAGAVATAAGGAATVAATCTTRVVQAGTAGAKLSFTGLDSPAGDYAGTIDLLPDDETKGVVDLTVRRTDFVIWPALVLAIGIALAIGVRAWVDRRNRLSQDQEDTWRLLDKARDAERKFQLRAGNYTWNAYTYMPDFEVKIREIITQLEGLKHDLSKLGEDDPKRQAALDPRKGLEAVVDAWPALAPDLDRLSELTRAAAEAATSGRGPQDPDRPTFLAWAEQLLRGRPLDTEDVLEQVSEIVSAASMAGAWPDYLKQVNELRKQAEDIREAMKGLPRDDSDRATLEAAFRALSEARAELWNAKDADELSRYGTVENIDHARSLLAGLGDRRAELEEAAAQKAGDLRDRSLPDVLKQLSQETTRLVHRELELELAKAEAPDQVIWTAEAPPAEARSASEQALEDPAAEAERIKRWRQFVNLIVVLVLGLAALWTGLTTLYFDKPFGTVRDYLNVLLWGFGVQVVLEGITAGVDRLRARTPAAPR